MTNGPDTPDASDPHDPMRPAVPLEPRSFPPPDPPSAPLDPADDDLAEEDAADAPARDDLIDETPDDLPPAIARDLQFDCDNCGASMRWDPDTDALRCAYCEHTVPVPRDEGTILERPIEEAGDAARGLGLERRVAHCNTCGADVSLDTDATADRCVYCGSPSVLDQAANRNAIRPESLIPLDVGKGDVERAFRKWITSRWFRPNALKQLKNFDAVGVYAPFWTFDCRVFSEWSADAGYYYWVTQSYWTTVNNRRVRRTRRVRKVRWVPKWGTRNDAYDDILVPASLGRPHDLVQKLGAYDLRALVPYRPEYLAGWRAEEYRVDLETGWVSAQQLVEAEQRRRCSGDVPGDTQRRLRVRNAISGVHWKHVLLPVWSLQYRFKQKTYTVLIHGQTGHVVGEAPYSWIKITLLVLAILAAGGAAAAIIAATGGVR
jgi:DNA-directed RNA polymerase subunit RPC12/RpoP